MPVMIDTKVAGDKVGVSAAPQTDSATAQTLNKLLLFDENSQVNPLREAVTNEAEKTGFNEPTDVDVLSRTAEGNLTMAKTSPDGMAWACRMLMGAPVTTALGAGFKHVFKLDSYPDHPDYFTVAHRKGGTVGSAPAEFLRMIGMGISQLSLNAARGEFLELALDVVGLGKNDDALLTETLSGVDLTAGFVMTLGNDVRGATDAIRAKKIDAYADDDGDGLFEMQLDIVSYVQTTNIATFADPSGTNATADVRVTYEADEGVVGYEWVNDLDALVTAVEFLAKAAQMRLYLGAAIDASGATPTRADGVFGQCELLNFSWILNRNAEASSCWRVDALTSDEFAQAIDLGQTLNTLNVSRNAQDWMMKQHTDENTAFGAEINAIGPEWEASNRFGIWIYFPFCKVLSQTRAVNDGKWGDDWEVSVLKNPDGTQPTVAVVVQNQVASYA